MCTTAAIICLYIVNTVGEVLSLAGPSLYLTIINDTSSSNKVAALSPDLTLKTALLASQNEQPRVSAVTDDQRSRSFVGTAACD